MLCYVGFLECIIFNIGVTRIGIKLPSSFKGTEMQGHAFRMNLGIHVI